VITQLTEKIIRINWNIINNPKSTNKFTFNSPIMNRVPRTSLLLRPAQMTREGYPQPDDKNYTATSDQYDVVTERSPLYSFHVEIEYNEDGEIEIAWLVLVNEALDVIQEIFVKPNEAVLELFKK
jgi:hypothetical protein